VSPAIGERRALLGEGDRPVRCSQPCPRRITEQRQMVQAAITNKLSNAAVEQVNTQIRLITRRGFGYHSPWAVIALAMLSLASLCPPLPGR
jgi:transposase